VSTDHRIENGAGAMEIENTAGAGFPLGITKLQAQQSLRAIFVRKTSPALGGIVISKPLVPSASHLILPPGLFVARRARGP
jgi:hypothetical protein